MHISSNSRSRQPPRRQSTADTLVSVSSHASEATLADQEPVCSSPTSLSAKFRFLRRKSTGDTLANVSESCYEDSTAADEVGVRYFPEKPFVQSPPTRSPTMSTLVPDSAQGEEYTTEKKKRQSFSFKTLTLRSEKRRSITDAVSRVDLEKRIEGSVAFGDTESPIEPPMASCSRAVPHSSFHQIPAPRNGADTYTAVTLALSLLTSIGDATNISYLQGLASLTVLIVDVLKMIRDNRDDCTRLSDRVVQLLQAIYNQRPGDSQLSEHYLHNIQHLTDTLDRIHIKLRKLCTGNYGMQALKAGDVAICLGDCDADLDHAVALFGLQSQMNMHAVFAQLEQEEERQHRQNMELLSSVSSKIASARNNVIFDDQNTSSCSRDRSKATIVLPPAPSIFFGRDGELTHLLNVISCNQPARAVICGTGGVGKTSLVQFLLHHKTVVILFGPRRHFISCASAHSFDNLVSIIAAHFGMSSAEPSEAVACDDSIQRRRIDSANLASNILAMLRMRDDPSVLVLDHLETPWDPVDSRSKVEDLLSQFSAINSLALLVTMRGTQRPYGPPWSRPLLPPLEPLDDVSAKETFSAIVDTPFEDPDVDALIRLTGNLPLAITLMASLAQYESTSSLLERWHLEHTSMVTRGSDSLEESIRLSITCARMEACPEAVNLLGLLSILPDGLLSEALDDLNQTLRGLKLFGSMSVLKQTALIFESNGRLRVLTPIRAYVCVHNPPPSSYVRALVSYVSGLVALTKERKISGGATTTRALVAEIGNIQAVIDYVLRTDFDPRMAIRLAVDLAAFQRDTSLGDFHILRRAADAAKQIEDKNLRADCLFILNSRFQDAIIPGNSTDVGLLEALHLYEETHNLSGQAECLIYLKHNAMYQNDTKLATERAERALNLFQQANNFPGQALATMHLARICWTMGHLKKAIVLGGRAADLYGAIGDFIQQATCNVLMGEISLAQADYRKATLMCESAIKSYVRLGLEEHFAHTNAVACLGDVSFKRGDYSKAGEQYSKILPIYQTQDRRDREANCLVNLANVSLALNRLDEAKQHRDTALEIWRDQLHNKWGEGCCLLVSGDIAHHEEDDKLAIEHYLRALDLFEETEMWDDVAESYMRLGDIYLARKNVTVAFHHFVLALVMFCRAQATKGQVECIQKLGDVQFAVGDARAATTCYAMARESFRAMGIPGDAMCGIKLCDIVDLEDGEDMTVSCL